MKNNLFKIYFSSNKWLHKFIWRRQWCACCLNLQMTPKWGNSPSAGGQGCHLKDRGVDLHDLMKLNTEKCGVLSQGGKSSCNSVSWGWVGQRVALQEKPWGGGGSELNVWLMFTLAAKVPNSSWAVWTGAPVKGIISLYVALIRPHVDTAPNFGPLTWKTWTNWSYLSRGPQGRGWSARPSSLIIF